LKTLTPDYYDEEYYDGGKGYHTYNDDARFQTWANDIVLKFKPRSVLDFGCAKGYLVKALHQRGVAAWGYDVSEWAINQADQETRAYLDSDKYHKVDLIVSYDTFEHIPEGELNKIRTELRKVGKRFYFTVGTLDTPNWEHDASHITMHELSWWQKFWPEAEWVESK
jgi:2-polyprenyl-3-methyl-5-hydroxy-6-metoxy-1,4-benzoquinol methylase